MTKKKIIMLITIILMLITTNCNVYASKGTITDALKDYIEGKEDDTKSGTFGEPIDSTTSGDTTSDEKFKPDSWKPSSTTSVSDGEKLEKVGNKIIGSVRVIGTIMSVITLIIIGIRYALGSLEEKAEYKKTMKPYIIGAVMVFAITNILGIVQDIVGGL